MIGAAVAPIVAKPAAPRVAAPAPAVAPSAAARPQVQAPGPAPVKPAAAPEPQPIALAETQALSSGAEPDDVAAPLPETPKYLPGDPMAPQAGAARQPAPRIMDEHELPVAPPMKDRKWLFLAIGGVVLLSVLLLVVGLMQ